MTIRFVPGDKVRCIDAHPKLRRDNTYTIDSFEPIGPSGACGVRIKEVEGVFFPDRFAPAFGKRTIPINEQSPSPASPTDVAVKHDEGKPPMDLLDPLWLEGVADVLAFGAKKYAAWNWAKGTFRWGRLFAGLMRHLWAFWRGEDLDSETGLPHLDHAACCLMFLRRYWRDSLGEDDRHIFVKKPIT